MPKEPAQVDTSKVKMEPKEKQKGAGKDKQADKKKVMPENPQVNTSKVKIEPKEKQKGQGKSKPPQKKKVMPKGNTNTDVKPNDEENLDKIQKNDNTPCSKGYIQSKEDTYGKAVSDWLEKRNLQNWQDFMKELDKEKAGALPGLIRGHIKHTERMQEKEKGEQKKNDEEKK